MADIIRDAANVLCSHLWALCNLQSLPRSLPPSEHVDDARIPMSHLGATCESWRSGERVLLVSSAMWHTSTSVLRPLPTHTSWLTHTHPVPTQSCLCFKRLPVFYRGLKNSPWCLFAHLRLWFFILFCRSHSSHCDFPSALRISFTIRGAVLLVMYFLSFCVSEICSIYLKMFSFIFNR